MKDAVCSLAPALQQVFGKGSLDVYLYADDTLLVGALQPSIQQLLDAIASAGARYGMELHWSKFKLLQVDGVYHLSAPGGTIIAPNEVMTYLGATLYGDGGVKRELNRKLGTAWGDFSKLSRLWNHLSLAKDRKIRIYKAVHQALVIQAEHCMAQCCRTETIEWLPLSMPTQNSADSAIIFSRASNMKVLQEAEETPLGKQLLRSQLLLFGRLVRAPDTDPLNSEA